MVIWRRWVFPILLVVIFALIAAALVKLAFFPDEQVAAEVPTAEMSDPVIPVARGSIVNQLDVAGTVARDEPVPLRSDVDGVVTEVFVGNGQHVAAGQPLVRVKLTDPERLVDFQAPFAGQISELALIRNQPTSVGTEFAQLTPDTFHVLGTIEPVQLYRLINAPTEATVTITGGPAPFVCTGLSVQVAEDATTSVRCNIPPDQTVFAGLPATVGITVGSVDDALVVPVTAVRGGSGSGVVWLDTGGGETEERTVTLGINDGTMVEVVEGLSEGDLIRQFVPGVVAPVEQYCYEISPGEEYCESGVTF